VTEREYPKLPMLGVGGAVIFDGRVLLVQRAVEPARGEWSIPGGLLEVGETLAEGVVRELREETGLTVRVVDLIEVVERIFPDPSVRNGGNTDRAGTRPRYHFVILDYLCERLSGEPRPNEEVSGLAFAREEELDRYQLNPLTARVLRKAFALAQARASR